MYVSYVSAVIDAHLWFESSTVTKAWLTQHQTNHQGLMKHTSVWSPTFCRCMWLLQLSCLVSILYSMLMPRWSPAGWSGECIPSSIAGLWAECHTFAQLFAPGWCVYCNTILTVQSWEKAAIWGMHQSRMPSTVQVTQKFWPENVVARIDYTGGLVSNLHRWLVLEKVIHGSPAVWVYEWADSLYARHFTHIISKGLHSMWIWQCLTNTINRQSNKFNCRYAFTILVSCILSVSELPILKSWYNCSAIISHSV